MPVIANDDRFIINTKTLPISGSTNPLEIVPAVIGRRPVITEIVFQAASGSGNVIVNSYNGSSDTALTGNIPMTTSTNLDFGGFGYPVMIGNAIGDSIRLTNASTLTLEGFCVVTYAAA